MWTYTQEDEPATLHITAAFLLFDGRSHEPTFEMMQNEGVFPKLVELVREKREGDSGLHRLLLELLYEMSRMQKLTREDLGECGDALMIQLKAAADEGQSSLMMLLFSIFSN